MTNQTPAPILYNDIEEGRNVERRMLQPRDFLLEKPGNVYKHDPITFHIEDGAIIGYRFNLCDGPVNFLAEPINNRGGTARSFEEHKQWCASDENTRKARIANFLEFMEAVYQARTMQDAFPAARAFLHNMQSRMHRPHLFDSVVIYDADQAIITHTNGNGTNTSEHTIPLFDQPHTIAEQQHPGLVGIDEPNLDDTILNTLESLGGRYCTPANLQSVSGWTTEQVVRDEALYELSNEQARNEHIRWLNKNIPLKERYHHDVWSGSILYNRPKEESIINTKEVVLAMPNLQFRNQFPQNRLSFGGRDQCVLGHSNTGNILGVVDAK